MQNLILNRYRPLEEAGAGGFATVLAAWDTRIQRKVAIKCMPLSGVLLNELGQENLASRSILVDSDSLNAAAIPGLEEARMAAMLNDANIVSVYEFRGYCLPYLGIH